MKNHVICLECMDVLAVFGSYFVYSYKVLMRNRASMKGGSHVH